MTVIPTSNSDGKQLFKAESVTLVMYIYKYLEAHCEEIQQCTLKAGVNILFGAMLHCFFKRSMLPSTC